MLKLKTVTFLLLVAVCTTLVQEVLCKNVIADGPHRLVMSNKRRINYKRDPAPPAPGSLPPLPDIQLPTADTAGLLASATPLLASVSAVQVPQLPALPGSPAPATGYAAPAAMAPSYEAAMASPYAWPAPPAAGKQDEDEEEEDEDEDDD